MVLDSLLKKVPDTEVLESFLETDPSVRLLVSWLNSHCSCRPQLQKLTKDSTGLDLRNRVGLLGAEEKLELVYILMGLDTATESEEKKFGSLKRTVAKWTFWLFCFVVSFSAIISGLRIIRSDLPTEENHLEGIINIVLEVFKLLFSSAS